RLGEELREEVEVAGVGTTGSGRQLAAVVAGADVVKNEITCHAVAASREVPGVRTVIEIGGQDSKLILLRDGIITDFAMNTVCAAGTGSFLDRQAQRLGIPIEEFGELALRARNPCRIAGRCTVFAESDMIHKQQLGHKVEDIVAGLCEAIARNYLNNLAKGKKLEPPIVFQGGVAANIGVKSAFEAILGHEVIVPEHHKVMGAIGAAMLAKEFMARRDGRRSRFRGFEVATANYEPRSFICTDCANNCEVVEIYMNGRLVGRWGCRCCKWSHLG
ncbi:MAG TPA: 2-hydroxyglutaryl-CoA dehydratase, partial [Armatimonadetes bacterium]|nr:2-hydroxyglutaryl-CoA dehydratase [Armatimonadota bacterium]